jgi:hypothetical protein
MSLGHLDRQVEMIVCYSGYLFILISNHVAIGILKARQFRGKFCPRVSGEDLQHGRSEI